MSTLLFTFEGRVSALLEDQSNRIFSTGVIDESIRQALSEYSIRAGEMATIEGLDDQLVTTLNELHYTTIVVGASSFAARSNLIAHLDTLTPSGAAAVQTALQTWGTFQLASFRQMLDTIFKAGMHLASTTPYSSLIKKSTTGDLIVSLPSVTTVTATIASGASLSDAIPTGGLPLCGIQMPAGWDAAVITFQAAADLAGNVANLFDYTGTEMQTSAAASEFIYLDPSIFAGAKYVKIRSGTSGAPVNQSATRSITLALRSMA